MILVDTSVWVDHLRKSDDRLVRLLESRDVLTHPFVVGELACGLLANRVAVLGLLRRLPVAPMISDAEALRFIERRELPGRGIGYIDVHLLAATMLEPSALLWTRDRRLKDVAAALHLSVRE